MFPCCIFISPTPQPQQYSQYSNYTTCCMILVFKTGMVNRFYSSPKTSRPALRPPTFLFNRCQGSFLRLNSQDTKLTAHLYLVSRLRMSGAVPLLPLFTFMVWMVIPFNSRFLLFSIHPSIPTPSICPTNRPVCLSAPFYIRTVQVNICKGFYNHSSCCRMYVLLHVLLTVNIIISSTTTSSNVPLQVPLQLKYWAPCYAVFFVLLLHSQS